MDEILINKYLNGESIRELSIKFKMSRKTISKILKNNNIHIRKSNETSKKYFVNENFFEIIDNEEKAYWLGFIYADGYIESKRKYGNQKFGITLASIDKNHLEKLNKLLKSSYKIHDYIGSGYKKEGKYSRLLITSQKMVDDLKDKGVVENKTKILNYPTFLDEELQRHFIRGYLDGDGSIYYDKALKSYRISFFGTKEFLSGINNFLKKENKIYNEKSIYGLNYNSKKDVFEILCLLYKNSNIYLDRKYEIFLKSIENISKDRV